VFEDEINDECNVETLVVSWHYYAVFVLLLFLHFSSDCKP